MSDTPDDFHHPDCTCLPTNWDGDEVTGKTWNSTCPIHGLGTGWGQAT